MKKHEKDPVYQRLDNLPDQPSADPYLSPYLDKMAERRERADAVERRLCGKKLSLADFASAHTFFGLHKTPRRWVFREWAPNASEIFLIGDFSDWQAEEKFRLTRKSRGVWEGSFPLGTFSHGMHYALQIFWRGGSGTRLPAYAKRVVQDNNTKLFSAQIWSPENEYVFQYQTPERPESLLVYEAHIGMALEDHGVGTYEEFRRLRIPEIAEKGYNTIQLMAVMEHPYYGSFGYHVSNFYAVSSRFGTPEEFKALVDDAHKYGLRVIIDFVHSHSVRNELEGLGNFDGRRETYFHAGTRGEHSAWDSLCFDYGKIEVLHFLLSNCRFYLDEYHIDGFRFDGVTSMLYYDHGLNRCFTGYGDYFDGGIDEDALTYLILANRVIHSVRPDAVTVAEDVSGLPGLAAVSEVGFDFRMAMGVTDMWFKLLDIPDENWDMFYLYGELTNRRRDERSMSYVECHDQAIVGGQSSMFTMCGAAMYDSMHKNSQIPAVDRAVALHKMMRLATLAGAGHGYLNFMGNEFGHPEWVDLPREGNNWSYAHARRQWSLERDENLRYCQLAAFDRAMMKTVCRKGFYNCRVQTVRIDNCNKILVFERDDLWFIFNFHPCQAVSDYRFEALAGEYSTVLDSDAPEFGGFALRESGQKYYTLPERDGLFLSVYLPPRTALVLQRHFK